MHHARLSYRILLFAFAALILIPRGGFGSDVTLTEIIAARTFFESSIQQLEGRYTFRYLPTRGVPHAPNALVMEDLLLEVSFIVDIDANSWRYEELKSWIYADISPTERYQVRTTRTSADNIHQSLMYTMAKDPIVSDVPPNVPHKLHYFPESRSEASFFPTHFAGIPIRTINQPIGELLKSSTAKLEGSDDIAGTKCIRVSVVAPTGPGLRFWLDPSNDFLPRRQELGTTDQGEATITIDSTEFQQFPDPVSGSQRWFPTKGRVKSDAVEDREWAITELRINPGLPKAAFLIDPASLPPGVAVKGDGRGGWHTGGRKDLFEEREGKVQLHDAEMERLLLSKRQLEPRSGRLPAATLNPVEVTPRDSRWIFWGMGILSAGVLVFGVFLIVRARQR